MYVRCASADASKSDEFAFDRNLAEIRPIDHIETSARLEEYLKHDRAAKCQGVEQFHPSTAGRLQAP